MWLSGFGGKIDWTSLCQDLGTETARIYVPVGKATMEGRTMVESCLQRLPTSTQLPNAGSCCYPCTE